MARVLTNPRYETVEAVARTLTSRRPVAADRRRKRARAADNGSALERGVELLERGRLSPLELRLLLSVLGGEVAVRQLARTLGMTATQVRRAAAPLYVRGLIRWREEDDRTLLDVTPAGLTKLRPLLATHRGAAGSGGGG